MARTTMNILASNFANYYSWSKGIVNSNDSKEHNKLQTKTKNTKYVEKWQHFSEKHENVS